MIRKHLLLPNEQYKFLSKLGGSISEHIRRAIDDYIFKIKKEVLNVSESPSKTSEMVVDMYKGYYAIINGKCAWCGAEAENLPNEHFNEHEKGKE